MGNRFSGSEIVELGIQIETNGRDFYNTLVNQSKNKKATEIFQYLEDEERKHIVVFQKILDSVNKYEPPESYPQDYFAYMNALASEHVFTQRDKGSQIAKNITSANEAVDFGIRFEQDSIVFYEGMKSVIPEYDYKLIDQLIKQEQIHFIKLTDLKKSII